MSRIQKTISLSVLCMVILACAIPNIVPAPEPIPTFDSNAPLTAIVLTFNAAATQTQRFAPPTFTSTATATRTPLPTETPSATFVFFLPTITYTPTKVTAGSSGEKLECQILSQSPSSNSVFAPSTSFVAKWTIANIGTHNWPSDSTDYRYISGDKIYQQPIYDFAKSVPSGSTTELTVSMKAPSSSGTYKTAWRIVIGKEQFCPMNLTIIVN